MIAMSTQMHLFNLRVVRCALRHPGITEETVSRTFTRQRA
jgi:hypothetical protein